MYRADGISRRSDCLSYGVLPPLSNGICIQGRTQRLLPPSPPQDSFAVPQTLGVCPHSFERSPQDFCRKAKIRAICDNRLFFYGFNTLYGAAVLFDMIVFVLSTVAVCCTNRQQRYPFARWSLRGYAVPSPSFSVAGVGVRETTLYCPVTPTSSHDRLMESRAADNTRPHQPRYRSNE